MSSEPARAQQRRGAQHAARRPVRSSSRRSSHVAPSSADRARPSTTRARRRARDRATDRESRAQSRTARMLSISGATRSKFQGAKSTIAARAGAVGERDQAFGLSATERVLLARRVESLERELPDRLEHPEALLAVRVGAAAEQALVEQRRQRVEVGVADAARRSRGWRRRGTPRAGRRASARRRRAGRSSTRSSRAAWRGARRRHGRP